MLFVADRGQLEGALAVANADQPLTANLTLPLTRDGEAVVTAEGDTFGSLAGTIPAAPDVFSLGFLTRTVPGLLPAGTAITLPDGTVTLDGGGCTAQAGDTLSSIAARLLSPFEQLTREALLWAAESAQLSVQQAQAALGEPASAPAAPSGPAAPSAPAGPDVVVSASQLHALYADLTNPGTPFSLSRVTGFLTSRAITLDLRPMPQDPAAEPVVHRVPDAAVRAADCRRHHDRLRDRSVPGDDRLPAVPGPVFRRARRAGADSRFRPGRDRAGHGGPAGRGGPARVGGRGALHRLLHVHPAAAGPGRARPVPGVLLPGGARRYPARHRRPVRDQRPGSARCRRGRDRGGQQGLIGVLRDRNRDRNDAGDQPAQHPGRRRRGDAARARRPAAAHAAARRAGYPPGHRGARRRKHDRCWPAAATSSGTTTRSPRSRPGWPPRSRRWPARPHRCPGC